LYLFHVSSGIYKFGITDNIVQRFKDHRKNNNLHNLKDQVIKIYIFKNQNDAVDVEKRVKQYINVTKINSNYKNGTEFFAGKQNVNPIIKMIDNLHDCYYNNSFFQERIAVLNKEIELKIEQTKKLNSKIKILELKHNIEKEKANIEKEKTKQLELKIDIICTEKNKLDKNIVIEEEKTKQLKLKTDIVIIENSKLDKNIIIEEEKTKQIKLINEYKCVDCNINVYKTSKRCGSCQNKFKIYCSISNRPSKEQIEKDLVELKTMVAVVDFSPH